MKALLAGYGGIGSNVYYPELQAIGYEVDIFDIVAPAAKFKNLDEISGLYDIVVICTPNYTHEKIARKMAELQASKVFIEKPGLVDSNAWTDLCRDFPDTQFHLVKNNLYRNEYGNILDRKDIIGVDINWLNNNRIPNPGSWFTNKELAFGGVSRDLMPHLYCFAVKIFGEDKIESADFKFITDQRWNLDSISSTDYGSVTPDGIYNVDDFAKATTVIDGVSLRLTASWKEGYDKQSITVFYKDGTTYEWEFGLCPAYAYGLMLQDITDNTRMDLNIHDFLDGFNG